MGVKFVLRANLHPRNIFIYPPNFKFLEITLRVQPQLTFPWLGVCIRVYPWLHVSVYPGYEMSTWSLKVSRATTEAGLCLLSFALLCNVRKSGERTSGLKDLRLTSFVDITLIFWWRHSNNTKMYMSLVSIWNNLTCIGMVWDCNGRLPPPPPPPPPP